MRTEIAPRAKKKSRLNRITHYNMHMVLKIKEEDRVLMSMKLEKRIASVETKRPRKNFWIVLWKKADVIENKLSDYYIFLGNIR